MTVIAGRLLTDTIVPMLAAVIARGKVRTVGSEDRQELLADTILQAAKMLDSAESTGKTVAPNSIAHYALQAAKSGRRSTSAGRTDAMSVGCQLDSKSTLCSLDEPLACGDDDGELCLHDMLAGRNDDPATAAGRNLDWAELARDMDQRRNGLVRMTAIGTRVKEIAAILEVSPPRIVQMKRSLAGDIERCWGDDVLDDVSRETAWQRHVRVGREQKLCRYEHRMA